MDENCTKPDEEEIREAFDHVDGFVSWCWTNKRKPTDSNKSVYMAGSRSAYTAQSKKLEELNGKLLRKEFEADFKTFTPKYDNDLKRYVYADSQHLFEEFIVRKQSDKLEELQTALDGAHLEITRLRKQLRPGPGSRGAAHA